jgi:hypothetical protein
METEKKSPTGRALRTVLPLLIALALMIGIAKLFVFLIGDGREEDSLLSERYYFSLRQEFLHDPFPPLSEAEKVLFIEKIALTPEEEAAFWPEFYLFANQFEQTDSVHRKWVDLFFEQGDPITAPDRVMKLYLSGNKRHHYLIDHFSDRFSKLLSADRMPWVFILHDRIRRERESANR